MDRLNQLRGEGGGTGDSSLDRSYPASDAYLTADESSAFYSLQNNSTFDVSSSKNESTINEDIVKTSETSLSDLSPIRQNTDLAFKIDEQIESANILSSDVNLFEDSSFDGNELVIDDKIEDRSRDEMKPVDDSTFQKSECTFVDATLVETETDIPSKDTEVVLQIDGKNVDAIDIGNGLYLYRKEGKEELAVVQIIDDDQQQPSFKFLKVRENSEGNLEVYEEIEVEVPKELTDKSGSVENISHVPIKDISKVISDPGNKSCERRTAPCTEKSTILSKTEVSIPDIISENKNEVNLNVKVMKISEARKSPIIGSFKPMTYHSTPNKEGVPLTKTMVEQQLHPNRNSDNIKKTIEVHTDGSKPKALEPPGKTKDTINDSIKFNENTTEISKDEMMTENLLIASIEQPESNIKDPKSQIIEKETMVIDIPSDKEQNPKDKNTNLQLKNIEIEQTQKTGETVTSTGLKSTQVELQTNKQKGTPETYSEYVDAGEKPSVHSSERVLTSTSVADATEAQSKMKTNLGATTNVPNLPKNIQDEKKVLKSSPLLPQKIDPKTQVFKKSEDSINLLDLEKSQEKVSKSIPASTLKNPEQSKDLQTTSSVALITTVNSSKKQQNEERPLQTVNSKELLTIECKGQKNVTKEISESKAVSIQPKKAQMNKNPTIMKNIPKVISNIEIKSTPINNNHAAVPFGQWTEANRQDFLNKIRESKLPVNTANTNQIKQTNDLNRRDVLKKFDSQRQSNIAIAKAQELKALTKHNNKNETLFLNKPLVVSKNSEPEKNQTKETKLPTKEKEKDAETLPKKDLMQDLIDKTIEGMINRVPVKTVSEDTIQNVEDIVPEQKNPALSVVSEQLKNEDLTSLEDIEKKMNELHGIPFIERPPHELPQIHKVYKSDDQKSPTKPNKSSVLPPPIIKGQETIVIENIDYSDDEVIEHEPVTGDVDYSKSNTLNIVPISQSKLPFIDHVKQLDDKIKKDTIITEKEFDHFAKRNSTSMESHTESIKKPNKGLEISQGVLDGRTIAGKYSKNDISHLDTMSQNRKSKVPVTQNYALAKNKEEVPLKNYHSKLQMAYQSALTAKRQMESPITIIEEKPVKVVFVDSNPDFSTQVQELSPSKRRQGRTDTNSITTADSKDSDILDSICESKSHDELRNKSRHQRKQVLTPVDTTDIELIEPGDLGIEVSPKRRKRVEELKTDRNPLNLLSKKSYLLSRDIVGNDKTNVLVFNKSILDQNDAVTAIDSLVKAAELIETQQIQNTQNTPVKRGRGRPRKYPLPEGAIIKDNIPSPQKKSRLTDTTPPKSLTSSDEDYDSDCTIIRENWTMGKINENLVCPICQKLFRSENVIFKHVKHCTGPSPNRSEKGSSRYRESQDSDSKSSENYKSDVVIDRRNVKRKSRETVSNITSEKDIILIDNTPPKKREYNPQEKNTGIETSSSTDTLKSETFKNFKFKSKPTIVDEDIIVINDTPPQKNQKPEKNKKFDQLAIKTKSHTKTDNLTCEICGKKFRQLSYLVSHKMQHKKEPKIVENDVHSSNSAVFSCETCKKVFRKLHHLVQHRIIHNPPNNTSYKSRKNSATDVMESKVGNLIVKQNEEQSAGFRCEPCDKSFRKLHHLVEHRETHDGINRQKNISMSQHNADKATSPQCDVCKKVFRKLHHLIEHREQHHDNKSEDKNVKSSLSTKDIIHECSLCYMVFPNEHSLNKHHIICQRKKRQSAAKQVAQSEPVNEDVTEVEDKLKTTVSNDINNIEGDVDKESDPKENVDNKMDVEKHVSSENIIIESTKKEILDESKKIIEEKTTNEPTSDQKTTTEIQVLESQSEENEIVSDVKTAVEHPIVIPKTETKVAPKTKLSVKDKVPHTVTKRQKTSNLPLPVVDDVKSSLELSDDDDVRYMINPDFNEDDSMHEKMFMKISTTKRDSLAIKKNITKRRTSTQYPPKIPRLKQSFVARASQNSEAFTKNIPKPLDEESVPSDDSDVKYSFPKADEQKTLNKNKTEKRKSLGGIAKRKSLGKNKLQKDIQKRIKDIGYKCDCGQLFSSAALLSRHTTLAHTPPRIRRRKSPPPDIDKTIKIERRKSSTTNKPGVKKLVKNDTTLNTKNDVPKTAIKNEITKPGIKSENAKPTNDTAKYISKHETSKPTVKNDATKVATKNDVTKHTIKSEGAKSVLRNDATKTVSKNEEEKAVVKTDPTKTIVKKDANKIVTKLGTSRKLSVSKTEAKGPSDTRKSDAKSGLVKAKLRRTTTHGGVPLPQKMKNLGKI